MSRTEAAEARRDDAAEANRKDLLYLAVLDSIEPNLTPIDAGAYYASAAISQRRTANALERIADAFELMVARFKP